MKHNILMTLFNIPSQAYQAFSELKVYQQTQETLIAQAVLIKKINGVITVADSFDFGAQTSDYMLKGSVIGALIGILGGPLGVLLGGSLGALAGTDIGSIKTLKDVALIDVLTEKLENDDVAIIALVQESDESTLDNFFGQFDSHVLRWDAHVVEQEAQDAAEVAANLAKEAKEQLKQKRKAQTQEKLEQLRHDVKAKFQELFEKSKQTLS